MQQDVSPSRQPQGGSSFRLEEATIDDLHARDPSRARPPVVDVVQHYLARVRAFNGVASMLVTAGRRARSRGDRHGARRRAAALSDARP